MLRTPPTMRRLPILFAVAVCLAFVAPAVARADVVGQWNQIAQTETLPLRPTAHGMMRGIAMVEGAVYDAVNAIDRGYQPYLLDLDQVVGLLVSLHRKDERLVVGGVVGLAGNAELGADRRDARILHARLHHAAFRNIGGAVVCRVRAHLGELGTQCAEARMLRVVVVERGIDIAGAADALEDFRRIGRGCA